MGVKDPIELLMCLLLDLRIKHHGEEERAKDRYSLKYMISILYLVV